MTEKSFFAGFGGQGIISLGQLWVYFAMQEGKNVTFFPFYGAEKRGGIARAGVIISDDEIASPLVTTPDSVLVMNADSLPLCEKILKKDGLMVINSTLVKEDPVRKDLTKVELITIKPSFLRIFSQRGSESAFITNTESGVVTRGLAISSSEMITPARAIPPRFSAP